MIDFFSKIDRELFLFLNGLHTPAINSFMTIISGQFIWTPIIGFCLFSVYKNYKKEQFLVFFLITILALIASDVTSSYILKNITERLRPCRVPELQLMIYQFGQKCGGKYGFVSSHAANSLVLAIIFMKTLSHKQPKIYFLWLMPILIGTSRIYLGVHYPGDILGGLIVGYLWGIFSWKVFENYQSRCQAN